MSQSNNRSGINISKKDAFSNFKNGHRNHFVSGVSDQLQSGTNQMINRVGSINSNPGSTVSRGSKYQQNVMSGMQNLQNSQSPPSVRNKMQMGKIIKNQNTKNSLVSKKGQNQYTMYQSNHLPMTSQQSRRKS